MPPLEEVTFASSSRLLMTHLLPDHTRWHHSLAWYNRKYSFRLAKECVQATKAHCIEHTVEEAALALQKVLADGAGDERNVAS